MADQKEAVKERVKVRHVDAKEVLSMMTLLKEVLSMMTLLWTLRNASHCACMICAGLSSLCGLPSR